MPSIDLRAPDLSVLSGHLKMGGVSPAERQSTAGREIAVNSRYLMLDGQPWLPVMGEFHFSRYPHAGWSEELRKMQAGGISIVATYLFWIHHEEIEGQFAWAGDRDLRRFVGLCRELGMYAYPRIGPWAHGECRNGGFPDWLPAKCGGEVRRDAPLYLAYVRRFYEEVATQLRGLLWKDGGPVVGIQIENELLDNAGHLATLKRLAREVGLDVPLYTMTGWGPAQVPPDEIIPVFGGYPDAPWDRQTEDWARASRKHYFFTGLRDDNTIGGDLLTMGSVGDVSYLARYPYGTCETGGGVQVTYHRRPFIEPDDVTALAYAKIGNGGNLLGYYMYHGGSNPIGARSTMQESQDTGYPNDLPVISYDFQAPLGEFGQVRQHYHGLRTLHMFLNDFGRDLAPLPVVLPDEMPDDLDDRRTLRWAARSDGHRGFVFVMNYQRVEPLPEHQDVKFRLRLSDGPLTFPFTPICIPKGTYAIWPFNMDLCGARLLYATAQPLCRIVVDGVPHFVFGALPGIEPELAFETSTVEAVEVSSGMAVEGRDVIYLRHMVPGTGCLADLCVAGGQRVAIILLAHAQGLSAWKATLWGQERLLLSTENQYAEERAGSATLFFEEKTLRIQTRHPEQISFAVFPAPECRLQMDGVALQACEDGMFARYFAACPRKELAANLRKISEATPAAPVKIGPAGVAQAPADADFDRAEVWQLTFAPDTLDGVHDAILRVDYTGDVARAYLGERLIADDFWYGGPAGAGCWEIGLKRFAPDVVTQGLRLAFLPLRADAPIYLAPAHRPDCAGRAEILTVRGVKVEAEYELVVTAQPSATEETKQV